ncbi:hypothetical protein OIO90_001948 [Microbotryomycetes sp. JL221]|nr:hypothetical protein OIO90_001948 [Microbotryomycetes sp. JL221]
MQPLSLGAAPFPVKFDGQPDIRHGSATQHSTTTLDERDTINDNNQRSKPVAWPADDEQTETQLGLKWGPSFTTDKEQYIQQLEDRLAKSRDSGYGSRSSVQRHTLAHKLDNDDMEQDENLVESHDDDDRDDFDSHQDLAGRPLLQPDSPPPLDDVSRLEQHHTGLQVIPPTPDKRQIEDEEAEEENNDHDQDDDDDALDLGHGLPSNALVDHNQRRISFNSHVRISGGMRRHRNGSHHHHHHHLNQWPSTSLETLPQATEALLVNPTVTNLSRPHSRSTSPSSASRSTSLERRTSINNRPMSLYSSSPNSYLASRSSSPCSSIYAPLQPSKQHCPNPMFIQSSKQTRTKFLLTNSQQHRTRSLTDLMLGRSIDSNQEDEEAIGTGEDYRLLVEQQKNKKRQKQRSRWRAKFLLSRDDEQESDDDSDSDTDLNRNQTKRHGDDVETVRRATFWTRVGALLALGASGAGPRPLPSFVSYGAISTLNQRSNNIRHQPQRRRSRGQVEEGSDSSEEGLTSQKRLIGRDKTDVDVMFGSSPGRWLTVSWWWFKMKRVGKSVLQAAQCGNDRDDEYESLA